MRNLAVVPARKGSKGIKDKNIKLLNDKPLLAYTIESAKKSGLFDEIMVSTNSEEYARIAEAWGASVPFLRGEELSSDTASSWDVVKDVLKRYQEIGQEFDTVALLQPTSPLRASEDIIAGYQEMERKNANLIVSVCEMDHSPLWCNTLPESLGLNHFLNKDIVNKPRQNLPTYYRINGALYIIKINYLISVDNIFSERSYAYIMERGKSIDIDEDIDFRIAECLMR